MKFYIETSNDNGSGMKYPTKDWFLKEISDMIDDCAANGGTYFSIAVDSDASCFCGIDEDECPFGNDPSNDCENCEFGDCMHFVKEDCVERE